ncbi:MAG: 4Fe-4S binding protein [Verrucomicrobiota bacterium]
MNDTAYKRIPVITDDCSGCGLCVKACDRSCIGLVWDFAKFQNAHDCGSCGHCMEACPNDVIHMDWIETTGDRAIGLWRDTLPEPEPVAEPKNWLLSWFGKRAC